MPSSGPAPAGTVTRRVIADPAGRPVAVLRIGNDSAGFARLLAAIAEVAPGAAGGGGIEGSRSYGIGLARALAAAGTAGTPVRAARPRPAPRQGPARARSARTRGAGRAAPGHRPAAGAARRR